MREQPAQCQPRDNTWSHTADTATGGGQACRLEPPMDVLASDTSSTPPLDAGSCNAAYRQPCSAAEHEGASPMLLHQLWESSSCSHAAGAWVTIIRASISLLIALKPSPLDVQPEARAGGSHCKLELMRLLAFMVLLCW